MLAPEDKISYRVQEPFFIVTLNAPERLNAMSYDDFLYVTRLLDKANENARVCFTVLQSTGKFFSAGADFHSVPNRSSGDDAVELKTWLENFLAKNQYITSAFIRHEKILVACLNGSAIGLSAAIVLLCDLVYCMDSTDPRNFLQFPFAKLALSCEGATSVTMPLKLGTNLSFSRLLFGERILFRDILGKIIVKDYQMNSNNHNDTNKNNGDKDVSRFNNLVINDISKKITNLYLPAVLQMKKVLSASNDTVPHLMLANSNEVHGALPFWVHGEPQKRFEQLRMAKLLVKTKNSPIRNRTGPSKL